MGAERPREARTAGCSLPLVKHLFSTRRPSCPSSQRPILAQTEAPGCRTEGPATFVLPWVWWEPCQDLTTDPPLCQAFPGILSGRDLQVSPGDVQPLRPSYLEAGVCWLPFLLSSWTWAVRAACILLTPWVSRRELLVFRARLHLRFRLPGPWTVRTAARGQPQCPACGLPSGTAPFPDRLLILGRALFLASLDSGAPGQPDAEAPFASRSLGASSRVTKFNQLLPRQQRPPHQSPCVGAKSGCRGPSWAQGGSSEHVLWLAGPPGMSTRREAT